MLEAREAAKQTEALLRTWESLVSRGQPVPSVSSNTMLPRITLILVRLYSFQLQLLAGLNDDLSRLTLKVEKRKYALP